MSINYTKMAAIAERLIDTNGQTVSFLRNSRSSADSAKPWRAPETSGGDPPVTVTAQAVVIPNIEMDDKDAVRRGDATAYIAAGASSGDPFLGVEFETFDEMTDADGRTWHVNKIDVINPGAIRVLYVAELKH